MRIPPSWRFERSQHHWNVWSQAGAKEFTSSFIMGNWRKCGQICCQLKEYLCSFAKMTYVPIQTYQKLLNLISFLNMYFAILSCWWVRKCFNPQGIFGSLTNVFTSSRLFPQMCFLHVRFQVDFSLSKVLSLFIHFPLKNPAIFPPYHLLPHHVSVLCYSPNIFYNYYLDHWNRVTSLVSLNLSMCVPWCVALFSLTWCHWFVILAWLSSETPTKLSPIAGHPASVPKAFTQSLNSLLWELLIQKIKVVSCLWADSE